MRQNQPVTEKLAKWAAATSWAALPAAVAHQAKRSLMNFFAVALTGCRDATIETTLASLAAFSSGGRATVIGRRERSMRCPLPSSMPRAPTCSISATPMCRPRSTRPRRWCRRCWRSPRRSWWRPRSPARAGDRPGGCMPHRAGDVAVALQQRLAHHCDLRRVRRRRRQRQAFGTGRRADDMGARPGGDAGGRPVRMSRHRRQKASASATRHAMACGRRCSRRGISPDRRSRSMACRAIITRSAKRRICRSSHDGLGETWEITENLLQALSVRLRRASGARLRAGLAARTSRRLSSRKSWSPAIRCMVARADRPDISTGREFSGQRAACRCGRAADRQGRTRTIHRCMRAGPAVQRCAARSA